MDNLVSIRQDLPRRKIYLGDGAYVTFDGYGLMLTTENGVETTNEIYLEPNVYEALVGYVARLKVVPDDPHPDHCLCDNCVDEHGNRKNGIPI